MPKIEHDAFHGLHSLVNSKDWQEFLKLLRQRKAEMQEIVNQKVYAKDIVEAYGALSRLKDIDKMLDQVAKKLTEIDDELRQKQGEKK